MNSQMPVHPPVHPAHQHRFLQLPWRSHNISTGESRFQGASITGHYNILAVSHDASRTGAPIVLLSFLMTLQKIAPEQGINLWIVLDRGGDLEAEFATCGPTLTIEHLVAEDYNREQAWREVLTRFRQFASEGMVLINTAAVPHVNKLCAQVQLPVLSWIHELSASIKLYCNGYRGFRHVLQSSRKIICASEAVRLALSGYGLDLESPQGITLYYGAMPVRHQGDRSTSATSCKQTIAADLHLSSDTFLVLGCGTVTLRKGCDVFVQVANHLVNCLGHRDVAFIWIGFSPDPHYLDWLQYDIHLAGLADHVFFAGQRDNPEDYLRGCDVFALTSREDPFPLVNLEAMYYGRPVVSFQGAGGAPEIHTHGRGMPVGYLNIVEMAEAIAHLKQNSDLAHQIGTTGQQYVQQELTWEKLVNQVLGILEADFGYASPARHLVRP